jgi:hypothetical protein
MRVPSFAIVVLVAVAIGLPACTVEELAGFQSAHDELAEGAQAAVSAAARDLERATRALGPLGRALERLRANVERMVSAGRDAAGEALSKAARRLEQWSPTKPSEWNPPADGHSEPPGSPTGDPAHPSAGQSRRGQSPIPHR